MFTAKFIGTSGSCGFQFNKVYKLYSNVNSGWIWITSAENKDCYCPYDSVESMLANWEILKDRKE